MAGAAPVDQLKTVRGRRSAADPAPCRPTPGCLGMRTCACRAADRCWCAPRFCCAHDRQAWTCARARAGVGVGGGGRPLVGWCDEVGMSRQAGRGARRRTQLARPCNRARRRGCRGRGPPTCASSALQLSMERRTAASWMASETTPPISMFCSRPARALQGGRGGRGGQRGQVDYQAMCRRGCESSRRKEVHGVPATHARHAALRCCVPAPPPAWRCPCLDDHKRMR